MASCARVHPGRSVWLAAFVVVALACSSGGPVCTGASCVCQGGASCALDCGNASPCAPTCSSFGSDCDATCADHCTYACTSGPNCKVSCGSDCQITCKSTSTCGATCGDHCVYTCTSVNDCAPTVGDQSVVTCTSTGSCDVTCQGQCRVHCASTGPCNVTCPAADAKTTCADGFACGPAC